MKKVNHYNNILPVGILLGLTAIAGLLLTSKASSAESTSANAAVIVPEACTMTSHNDTPHTATLSPSTYSGASGSEYENGIGKTTLTAICNDSNGFAIYAIGYTGNSYDSENHTKLVGSSTERTIDTAVYTNNDTPSNWSMKVTKITNSSESYNPQNMSILNSFDSWHVVPANYTKVAQYHANTGSSVTDSTLGAKIETTYAAFIAPNQPSDTYIGQVKYTMVHPYTEAPLQPQTTASGKICYYPNGSNVDGTMGCQTIPTSGTTDGVSPTSATLLASNFSRTGYGFAGWSDKFDYATNNEAKFYGPQETITYENGQYVGEGKGLSLYAVWVKSVGNLQDIAKVAELCGNGTNALTAAPTDGTANLESVSALTDQRDNNTYSIAKLADGNCWMIENLRLQNTGTDNTNGSLAQGYGGQFAGLADAESTGFTTTYTANSLYYSGTQEGTASIDIGTTNSPAYRMPRYNNWNNQSTSANRPQNPTTNSAINSTTSAGMYSYGNYYTWHAAIANLTHNGTTNQTTTGTSLCPTGWHLPTGGLAYASGSTSGVNVTGDTSTFREFYNLGYKTMDEVKTAYEDTPNNGYAYYSSNTTNTVGKTATAAFRSFPNNFLYSGYFTTSSALDRGSRGYYWSSTAYNNLVSYYLLLNSSSVLPGTGSGNKYYGYSIRCTMSAGT